MNHRRRFTTVIFLALALFGTACGGSERSELIRQGRDLFTDNGCSTCHGGRGQGGIGPALGDVLATFSACDDQVDWVRLGSDGWLLEQGDRYGDSGKPVAGGMPGFRDTRTDTEIRTVIAYERIEFAGADEAAARADCDV